MTVASTGAQTKFCTEPGAAAHTFDASSEPFEYLSKDGGQKGTILDTNAMRGTRDHASERTRQGTDEVGFRVRFNPSVNDLDIWLPRILGAAESVDSFVLGETLITFGALFDLVGDTHEYTDCLVNTATFRSREGGYLELEMDIWGVTEATGTSYPALTLGTTDVSDDPFVHSDCVLTLQSAAREVMEVEVTIDNKLERRYANSITATSVTPQDREVRVVATVPYGTGEASALYDQAVAGATGTLVYTISGVSLTFTFGRLQVPPETPNVTGKTEVGLRLDMMSRAITTTESLVVTNDAAP